MITDSDNSVTSWRNRSSRRAWTETSRPPVGSSMNTSAGPGHQVARDLQALLHAAREGAAAGRRCDPRRSRPAPASPAPCRGCGRSAGRPPPSARSPMLAPALTPRRRPSRGFWCTRPQSVRISRRRAGSDSCSTSTTPSCRVPVEHAAGIRRDVARDRVQERASCPSRSRRPPPGPRRATARSSTSSTGDGAAVALGQALDLEQGLAHAERSASGASRPCGPTWPAARRFAQ